MNNGTNGISKERIKYFRSLTLEQLDSITYRKCSPDEARFIVAETPMRDEHKRMAVAFFIDGLGDSEVAAKFNMTRQNAWNIRKKLHQKCIDTIIRITREVVDKDLD